MAKKMPRVSVRRAGNSKWELVVNGEVRLLMDDILEKKMFDSGNGIAVVYQEKNAAKLFIITLDPPMEEHITLRPRPSPGFAMQLLPEKKGKNFTLHYRGRNKFYIFRYFFDRIKTDGPFDEKTADKLLEEEQSKK